jgi:hypothetical protein
MKFAPNQSLVLMNVKDFFPWHTASYHSTVIVSCLDKSFFSRVEVDLANIHFAEHGRLNSGDLSRLVESMMIRKVIDSSLARLPII